MHTISIVRVRQNCCEQWDIDSLLKRSLAPILGGHLVQFEAMQGQAVVPVRQMAVWASAFRHFSQKNNIQTETAIIDAPATSVNLWDSDTAIFFMDACNAIDTVKLANDCISRGTRTIIASGAPKIYQKHIKDASDQIEWRSLDIQEVASILSIEPSQEDLDTILQIPAWDATLFGDYCPYFVPVSLARPDGSPRKTSEILEEIKHLENLGILKPEKRLLFDSPFHDEAQCAASILSIASALVTEEKLWGAWIPGTLNVREIAKLRRSGMGLACLGRTMNFNGLMHDGEKRPINKEQLGELKTRGIVVIADCMVCDETNINIMDIIRADIDIPNVLIETPYPEMDVFKQMEADGRITSYDWSQYDGMHVVFKPIHKTASQLEINFSRCRSRIISAFNMIRRLISPSQISMWYHSTFSFAEATALRLALASSCRRLMSTKSHIQMLSEFVLVGKY